MRDQSDAADVPATVFAARGIQAPVLPFVGQIEGPANAFYRSDSAGLSIGMSIF
jgi:hypothetical protein